MPMATMLQPVPDSSAAFGSTILSVRPALLRFALRLTKDHAAAEDLVQDTLARAWAAQARFDPGSNVKAWLFRIARNAFLSGVRRTRRQVAWDPDRHHLMLVQEATQDEALYARDLDAALSRLPAGQRNALQLITLDGMSLADAANELGVALGTIKSRVARARASVLAYVATDPEAERPETFDHSLVVDPFPLPEKRARESVERIPLSRYEQWKASGVTTIG